LFLFELFDLEDLQFNFLILDIHYDNLAFFGIIEFMIFLLHFIIFALYNLRLILLFCLD